MKLLIGLLSLLLVPSVFAQGVVSNACNGAVNLCNGDIGPFSIGASPSPIIPTYGGVSNPSTNPNPGNSGCLASGELNPNWFIISIESSGDFEFSIHPTICGGGFLDWIMWEYTDSTTCLSIMADTLVPIACNANLSADGMTGMASIGNIPAGGNTGNFETPINVNAGDKFIVCFSNYSAQVGNYTVDNFGTAGICQSTTSLSSGISNSTVSLITLNKAFEIKGLNEFYSVTIVDMQGRIKMNIENTEPKGQIGTAQLESALYFIYVETQSELLTFTYYNN